MHKIAHAIDTHARVVVGSSLLVVHPVLPPVVVVVVGGGADFFPPPPPLEVSVVFSSVLIIMFLKAFEDESFDVFCLFYNNNLKESPIHSLYQYK